MCSLCADSTGDKVMSFWVTGPNVMPVQQERAAGSFQGHPTPGQDRPPESLGTGAELGCWAPFTRRHKSRLVSPAPPQLPSLNDAARDLVIFATVSRNRCPWAHPAMYMRPRRILPSALLKLQQGSANSAKGRRGPEPVPKRRPHE